MTIKYAGGMAFTSEHPPVYVTVDVVVLTVRAGALQALLVRRGGEPHRGRLALPGGFVRPEEGLESAAARELHEETGLDLAPAHLEQLGSYGRPERDPRARTVSVAYLAILPTSAEPTAGTDAADALWLPTEELTPGRLAFDHDTILADGIERTRSKLEYSPLATAFCGAEFTIADLRQVYEIIWGRELDASNFHRKVSGTDGFIVPTERTRSQGRGRPAQLFTRGAAVQLHPAILR